jgi:hypothetical protein
LISTVSIAINPLPTVTISGDTVACQNQPDVIYYSGNENNTYQWQVTGGEITNGADQKEALITWTNNGTGIISLIETNEFGCSNNAELEVILHTAPQPSITGDNSVCANSSNVLYSSGTWKQL